MTAAWHLPLPDQVAPLLRDLLGRQVSTAKAKGPMPSGAMVVATYVVDEGPLSALCVLDFQLAAHVGAALMMMPAGVADESVRAKKLDETLLENAREVLNIGSRWFMPPEAPHVKMADVYVLQPGGAVPAPVAALMKAPPKSVAVEVTIAGYKGGRLTLCSR